MCPLSGTALVSSDADWARKRWGKRHGISGRPKRRAQVLGCRAQGLGRRAQGAERREPARSAYHLDQGVQMVQVAVAGVQESVQEEVLHGGQALVEAVHVEEDGLLGRVQSCKEVRRTMRIVSDGGPSTTTLRSVHSSDGVRIGETVTPPHAISESWVYASLDRALVPIHVSAWTTWISAETGQRRPRRPVAMLVCSYACVERQVRLEVGGHVAGGADPAQVRHVVGGLDRRLHEDAVAGDNGLVDVDAEDCRLQIAHTQRRQRRGLRCGAPTPRHSVRWGQRAGRAGFGRGMDL